MPKKDTKLVQLSEKVHIAVEEMKNLGVENLDHTFLEIYIGQPASSLTADNRRK